MSSSSSYSSPQQDHHINGNDDGDENEDVDEDDSDEGDMNEIYRDDVDEDFDEDEGDDEGEFEGEDLDEDLDVVEDEDDDDEIRYEFEDAEFNAVIEYVREREMEILRSEQRQQRQQQQRQQEQEQQSQEQQRQNRQQVRLPRPDEHSYLGTELHPLLPHDPRHQSLNSSSIPHQLGLGSKRPRRRSTATSDGISNNNSNNCSSGGDGIDLDDLEDEEAETDGHAARASSPRNAILELAVLELPGVVLFPGCTIPVKLHDRTMISYIGRQLDLARSDPSKQPQVHIGVITWTGGGRSRHDHTDGNYDDNNNDDDSSLNSGSSSESEYEEEVIEGNAGSLQGLTAAFHRVIDRRTRRAHQQRHSWMRRSIRRHGRESRGIDISRRSDNNDDDEDDNAGTNDAVRNGSTSTGPRKHHSIGRIGTIATVTQTHERTSGMDGGSSQQRSDEIGNTSLWNRYSDAREIVFTAIGTSRFRIVDVVDDSRNRYDGRDGNVFLIEDLLDVPIRRPRFLSRPVTSAFDNTGASYSSISTRTKMWAHSLSQVTPIPCFIYAKLSPWSLMEQIVYLLKSQEGHGNLPILDVGPSNTSSAESDDDDEIADQKTEEEYMDPLRFSFWIANNAPFSQHHKIKLLQMHSTVERLEDVLKGLRKLTNRERSIVCSQCSTRLTTSGQVFTVEGAEGATSTYVNDNGAIHQIMTLRQVDETKIGFQGRASIENTYFPGYCWLISYCRNCYSHLGWKFQKLDDSPNKTNRPESFWGFMSSNVKTSSR